MKKVEIEVPEGKRAEWVNGVLTLVDERPENVMERIKTFDDACKELGDNHPLVEEWNSLKMCKHIQCDTMAYLQLGIIVAALNEGWEPTFAEGEERWYPYFTIRDGGVAYADASYDSSYTYSFHGSRLAFRSKKLAEYAGQQLIDYYKAFILGK